MSVLTDRLVDVLCRPNKRMGLKDRLTVGTYKGYTILSVMVHNQVAFNDMVKSGSVSLDVNATRAHMALLSSERGKFSGFCKRIGSSPTPRELQSWHVYAEDE